MILSTQYCKKYLLEKTDWTQLIDVDLTAEEKQAWAVYRQALRDLDNNSSMFSLSWPVPPAKIIPTMELLQKTNEPDVLITLNIT